MLRVGKEEAQDAPKEKRITSVGSPWMRGLLEVCEGLDTATEMAPPKSQRLVDTLLHFLPCVFQSS